MPTGLGNTGLADIGLIAATLVTALWVSGRGHRIVLPYAWPVALTIAAGALAGLVSGGSLLALVQDAFVFAWPLAVVNLARGPRLLDVMVRAWGYSAAAWGCLLVVGVAAGVPWLSGTTARDGSRAALTLGDPNLAASYFLCGLFVLRAAQRPRGRWPRLLYCAIIVVALGLPLSNGGALTLVIATVLGWVFGIGRTRGLLPAVAALCSVGLIAVAAVASINLNTLADRAQQSTPLLRDSIGRQGESSSSRDRLLVTEIQLWLHSDNLLGIGPGATESTLREHDAAYVKEAHNDYLASLVERGVIGPGGCPAGCDGGGQVPQDRPTRRPAAGLRRSDPATRTPWRAGHRRRGIGSALRDAALPPRLGVARADRRAGNSQSVALCPGRIGPRC